MKFFQLMQAEKRCLCQSTVNNTTRQQSIRSTVWKAPKWSMLNTFFLNEITNHMNKVYKIYK